MTTPKKFVALAVAGALATGMLLSTGASSRTGNPEASPATTTQTAANKQEALIQTADEFLEALQEVRKSRVAIFNGDPVLAVELAAAAERKLSMAQDSMGSLSIKTSKAGNSEDAYVPLDVSVDLAEGFVPTEDNLESLKKAAEHLSKGDQRKAIDALTLADVGVSIHAVLLPAGKSLDQTRHAVSLMGEQKYYEANLALKAVEDSVVVKSYDAETIPVQGTNG